MVDWKQLDVLKSELAAELEEIGYLPPEKLDAALVMQSDRQKQHEAIRFQGELRYHYAANDGASRFRDDSRLRTRLYLDADLSQFADYLDDSWRAYTMFEYEYSLKAHRETRRLFERPRFYIEGMTGVTELTLGRYGYMLAEGNVYDTSFTGINAEVQVANATYRAGYGQSDLISRGYILEADVDCFDYSYGAGLYALYDNDEVRNTIMMAKGAYLFDDYRVGVMYLHSSHDSAEQRGYVYSLDYGRAQSWLPGTYELFAKYYDQECNTYIAHTMTGMGGRMRGFRGYQLGGYYTLEKNLIAGIEYYDLQDKITGEAGRTLWSQITYYF